MRLTWKIFRALVSILLLAAVVLPAAIYVLLSIGPIQRLIRDTASAQMSELLGANVGIGEVRIHPFNRATVEGISLTIGSDTIASISTVSAGFEIWPLVSRGEIVVDYALLDGVRASVNRPTPDSPLNIQPIIDRLKSDRPSEKKAFQVEISTVIVRRASASYDVLSAPYDSTCFDASHIQIRDLAINAFIPQISDRGFILNLDHLSFVEQSGFVLDKLTGVCLIAPDELLLENFAISLPDSYLALAPISIKGESIAEALKNKPTHIATEGDAIIYPPDIAAFVPILSHFNRHFELHLDALGCLKSVNVRNLSLLDTDDSAVTVDMAANVTGLDSLKNLKYILNHSTIEIDGPAIAGLLAPFLKADIRRLVTDANMISFDVQGEGTLQHGDIRFSSVGETGRINVNTDYFRNGAYTRLRGDLNLENVDLAILTGQNKFGNIDASGDFNIAFDRRLRSAKGNIGISKIEYNGYAYQDILIRTDFTGDRQGEISVSVNDPSARMKVYALYDGTKEKKNFNATVSIADLDLDTLGFSHHRPGYKISAKMLANMNDINPHSIDGSINISDFRWVDDRGRGLAINRINAFATHDERHSALRIESPYIAGKLQGHYDFKTLLPQLKGLFFKFMPALCPDKFEYTDNDRMGYNDFTFDFELMPTRQISDFFNLPIENLDKATLSGKVDSRNSYANIDLNVPYIYNGKIIENTDIFGQLDMAQGNAMVYATTMVPTKKGPMSVAAIIKASDDNINTHIDWDIDRAIPINGTMDFSATLLSSKVPEGSAFPMEAVLDMRPGTINFGDETWRIEASRFHLMPDKLNINDFALDTGRQRIEIDGNVGSESDNKLSVSLHNVSLLPIFETLEIDKAMIGGCASGNITASDLLSGAPKLYCPILHVDSIGYNRCTIGNADISAQWNNERKGVYLDAAITGFEGRHSRIDGYIFPMTEALDINFNADSVPVSFLKPFMSAFASDVTGRASGHCRLFGTFKEIDLEGDIYADNVGLRIDFTNTMYHATDSVHLRPGKIVLDNLVIRDPEGHTARLNGQVGHTFFKAPTFDFNISNAQDFLSYNVTSKQNPDWYGTIYGNGGASIKGYPGIVKIDVKMTTAPRSTFTFVLSDRLDAENYSFLSFRDVTPDSLRAPVKNIDYTPLIVKTLKEAGQRDADEESSQYDMDIAVAVTPDARITLVMDPAGGDKIEAVGAGDLHMAYRSLNNDLNIWGKYVVQSGSYHFTLQDIIVKDFIIKDGSEIKFDGDPYGVKTNLSAYFATNANLSDLDESFLQDKEVARTNVPVHALMKVDGDIRQPSIVFDLEFPTLTQDTYRKVRSIVSTEDMMNRQIIYLLALNRFYTPDYMASTTKGNELFSVASSTIASQLGNMLGKLSDNWSIAPNLRSDRGDFSDIEVDLALSSRLLNNRLLFNGNFGYRDNSLNNNQFVGDFDIEYLLNKRGSWRLKAYNRYNDRNFYVRSAQTTQGVGIMFRRDFDRLFNFLRPKKKESTDSIGTEDAK